MKKTYILLMLCCAIVACKRNDVNFSYSPEAPRAGQPVTFTNLSSGGEEWAWSFGDGASSTLKAPTHTYKKPGTYQVVLKVDKRNAWTKTKQITVYDTVPTFVASDSTFYIYEDYTFTANVYNPYNHEVKYEWWFPANTIYAVVTDSVFDQSTLHLYFIQPMETAPIGLTVIMNGDTTEIEKSFKVQNKKAHSVLFRTQEEDYRQRIFGSRAEMLFADPSAGALLDAEQDTMQVYNSFTFRLSELQTVFPEMEGFHIANRKIYFRAGGLWVANIDGANIVPIDDADCYYMTLDTQDSRIYWANEHGVWYMPFIGSDNNKFVSIPEQLNELDDVTKIAVDGELR